MTGSQNSQSLPSLQSMNVDNSYGIPPAVGPYAKPSAYVPTLTGVDAVLIDAIRACAGPYVPAPWRTRAALVQGEALPLAVAVASTVQGSPVDTTELPWIDAFIDDKPMTATPSDSEPWPLGEMSSTIRTLINGLEPTESTKSPTLASEKSSEDHPWEASSTGAATGAFPELPVDSVGQTVDMDALETALHAPLPMWRDDDLMDIMPVHSATDAPAGAAPWAEQARREVTTANHAEAAATLLEAIASRVRDGSLVVPGFVPSMSDAAGLATALAALLSSRE